MKIIFILAFFLFVPVLFSQEPLFATVEHIKGTASAIYPPLNTAVFLKEGDKLPLDSTVLTREKSFVKISLPDKSLVTLSPDSKIWLRHYLDSKMPSLLNLLQGKLKAKVMNARHTTDEKFVIKTKNASLGVRGTEFIVAYNEENEATSLITIEGAVAIAPKNEKKENIAKAGEFIGINKETDKITSQRFSQKQLNSLSKENIEKIKFYDDDGPVVDFKTAKLSFPSFTDDDGESVYDIKTSRNKISISSGLQQIYQETKAEAYYFSFNTVGFSYLHFQDIAKQFETFYGVGFFSPISKAQDSAKNQKEKRLLDRRINKEYALNLGVQSKNKIINYGLSTDLYRKNTLKIGPKVYSKSRNDVESALVLKSNSISCINLEGRLGISSLKEMFFSTGPSLQLKNVGLDIQYKKGLKKEGRDSLDFKLSISF